MNHSKSNCFIYLFVLLLILINGCQNLIENEQVDYNENEIIHPFFPLKVGFKWFYSSNEFSGNSIDSNSYNLVYEVVGDKNINGRTFYIMSKTYLNPQETTEYIDTSYFAISNDTLFTILKEFYHYKQREIVQTIFDLNVEDNFLREGYEETLNMEVKVVDKTENMMHYYGSIINAQDADFKEIYIRNIGLYESRSLAWSRGIILVKTNFE